MFLKFSLTKILKTVSKVSVFELLQNFNYDNVEGFGEFKKLFENGIEEFLNGFWDVGSDLEIYLSKLK